MLKLCTLALDTVVPSSSTGSKSAIGFISPVLDALHSIPVSFVSAISSFHLNAIAFLGNLEVCPSELPYAISWLKQRTPVLIIHRQTKWSF